MKTAVQGETALTTAFDMPDVHASRLRHHSTKGEDGAGARADLPCFPPCANRGVDGIFRPGGGRLQGKFQDQFQDAREHLPER